MELVRLTSGGRDLYVLLVENEQRTMEIRTACMVDPLSVASLSSSIRWVRSSPQVSCKLNQPLFQTNVPIELGIEIGGIEKRAEPLRQRFA